MILILSANFRSEITDELEANAVAVLENAGESYEIVHVPGAVELPVAAQYLIRKHNPAVVIALGCVIKGKTDHYEYVMQACVDGLTQVSIEESTPIIQGVLPCHNIDIAHQRIHKGTEYAETALAMKKLCA